MSDVDDFLAHYGKKGMKWGRRKEEDNSSSPSPTKPKGKPPEDTNSMGAVIAKYQDTKVKNNVASAKELQEYALKRGADPVLLAAKYGPPGAQAKAAAVAVAAPQGNFYQRHKAAINVGAGIAVVGLAAYGGHKLNQNRLANQGPIDVGKVKVNSFKVANAKIKLHTDYGLKEGKKKGLGNFDPDKLPTDPITLKAGTIVKRVSSENESTPRKGGFFAAHEDGDVERYKAMIPTFWPMWGIAKTSGHVVNLRADQEIKAPSRKQAYDLYESMVRAGTVPVTAEGKADPKKYAKETYLDFTAKWAGDNPPFYVKDYFSAAKKQGYNALVDENDAGTLAKNPMRYLDGTMFTTQPSTPLDSTRIKQTQIVEAKKLKMKGNKGA